jgi:hypothetical protein
MESRTVTDETGRHWECRLMRTSEQLVLGCTSGVGKSPVFVSVGQDWETMPEQELALRILESLG